MNSTHDVHELIGEQAEGPEERVQLSQIADALDEALQAEVPYRPEFRAALRDQLMAEARRTLLPWYRRPVVWGSSIAAAAAAAVVMLGIWYAQPGAPGAPSQVAQNDGVNSFEHSSTPRLTSDVQIPQAFLPDELVTDQRIQPEPVTGLDPSLGVPVYLLRNAADLDQFQRVAANLGITGIPQQVQGGYWIGTGDKSLTMSTDGRIIYVDAAAASSTGSVIDADGAREAAYRFLNRAALPVPDLQPVVSAQPGEQGGQVFQVTYTPRLDGRPVVNGRTVVWLTDRSRVFRAEAYVYAREESIGSTALITAEEAVNLARSRGGGQFGPEADLVYVRAAGDGVVYLQPQWRVFGQDSAGDRVVRYIPAMAAE